MIAVQPAEMRHLHTDASPTFLGVNAAAGPWLKQFDGRGVVVGVIDTGIWPEHPSVADDGSYAPPPPPSVGLPCEFGNTAANPNDAPFTCNNKLIGAREFLSTYKAVIGLDAAEFDSARDDNGHGTHTLTTAAGNAGVPASLYGIPRGNVSGIAPRAHTVAYKACATEGCFTSDLAAAIDRAVADGVDVINYSIGGGAGQPNADEMAFLFAADAGVFVATSAGNSGPGAGTVGNPATMPWVTSVGASTQSRFWEGTITLGNGAVYAGASITGGTGMAPLVDAAAAGSELCVPGALNPAVASGKIVLCRRGTVGRAAKSYAVQLAGGVGMILYNTVDVDNLFTDSHSIPSAHVDLTPGLAIKSYIAAEATPTAQLTAGALSNWPYAPSMTIFSSRGPNVFAPDIIKPDVTAPGIQILAGHTAKPADPQAVPGELFQAIAGTSMSSPHVAGVYALLKQAHPDWSAAAAKSALMTTAYQQNVLDNDRVSPADPFDFGAGHIRPGDKWIKGSVTEPGLVYDAGFLDYLGFLCDEAPEVYANPAATCASLAAGGVPIAAENLNYPSIGVAEVRASITVQRKVTSVAKENGVREYTAQVEAPPGFTVSVEPSKFSLRSGASQTFSLRITKTGAPNEEWRFGALTWKDKTQNFSVRSPIALKGAP